MTVSLWEFKKSKRRLLCVDSDGCAIDSMNIKHIKCFAPCFVEEWDISDSEYAQKRWNEINLFSLTRGINRFKALAQILCELYPQDAGYASFRAWTDSADELSDAAVARQIDAGGGEVFKKALSWSRSVNRAISALPEESKKAFLGVREALSKAQEMFDIAIVSSANYDAVKDEWERCGILSFADCIATQRDGSKKKCIAELVKKGYCLNDVLMVGDAVGDMEAAESNGVGFYPILAGHEEESWKQIGSALDDFVKGVKFDFKGKFIKNLSE